MSNNRRHANLAVLQALGIPVVSAARRYLPDPRTRRNGEDRGTCH
ncbi:hypothetical protein FHT78_004088 [Rhizobium sp. BK196]|nr:hypothetical protein [Rhizobium sp. BK196]